jgi:hypothetical protein
VIVTVVDPNATQALALIAAVPGGGTDDRKVAAALEAAGFAVAVVDDNDLSAAGVLGFDGLIIGANVSALVVADQLTDVAVPIINFEYKLHDELGLTGFGSGNRGELGSSKAIDIVDPTHPIAAGFSGSTEVFNRWLKVTWGRPSSSADVIATRRGDASRPVIFTYETGAAMANGAAAPARRVGLFLAANSDGELTAAGEQLLVNAATWLISG